MLNAAQVLEQKILFHTYINNKNTCKIVCKIFLNNGLKFNGNSLLNVMFKKWLEIQCIIWLSKFN